MGTLLNMLQCPFCGAFATIDVTRCTSTTLADVILYQPVCNDCGGSIGKFFMTPAAAAAAWNRRATVRIPEWCFGGVTDKEEIVSRLKLAGVNVHVI